MTRCKGGDRERKQARDCDEHNGGQRKHLTGAQYQRPCPFTLLEIEPVHFHTDIPFQMYLFVLVCRSGRLFNSEMKGELTAAANGLVMAKCLLSFQLSSV